MPFFCAVGGPVTGLLGWAPALHEMGFPRELLKGPACLSDTGPCRPNGSLIDQNGLESHLPYPTVIRRLSDGYPTVIRRLSDGYPTVIRRYPTVSDGIRRRALVDPQFWGPRPNYPTVIRRLSDGHPTVIRQLSDGHPTVIRRLSDGNPKLVPAAQRPRRTG